MASVTYTTINGQIVAENRNGARSLYVPDSLGSSRYLVGPTSQTLTDSWSYWPNGESSRLTCSTPTPMQFVGTQGYRQDSPTRCYVRARNRETRDGRWMTVDRAAVDATVPNPYE